MTSTRSPRRRKYTVLRLATNGLMCEMQNCYADEVESILKGLWPPVSGSWLCAWHGLDLVGQRGDSLLVDGVLAIIRHR